MALDRPPSAGSASRLGNYELLKELSGGGVGATWLARPASDAVPGTHEPVTILRLYRHLTKKTEVADGVLREAGIAQKIRFPNVLAVIDAGVADGEVFVVTEYAEAEPLSSLITAAGPEGLPLAVVLRIGIDMLKAVASAHSPTDPLVHGELNPGEVRVGIDGVTRVSGFGVARAIAGISPMGAKNHDRLAYAAPERVKAMAAHVTASLDPRVDLFSFGIILWEALAKQRLFASKLESAIIQKVLTAPIPAFATVAGVNVPALVEEALRRALDRDPARRFATAAEMLAAFEAASEGRAADAGDVAATVNKVASRTIEARKTMIAAAMVGALKPAEPRLGAVAPRKRGATLVGVASPLADAQPGSGERLAITAPSPRPTSAAVGAGAAAEASSSAEPTAPSSVRLPLATAAAAPALANNGAPARPAAAAPAPLNGARIAPKPGAAIGGKAIGGDPGRAASDGRAPLTPMRARAETLPRMDPSSEDIPVGGRAAAVVPGAEKTASPAPRPLAPIAVAQAKSNLTASPEPARVAPAPPAPSPASAVPESAVPEAAAPKKAPLPPRATPGKPPPRPPPPAPRAMAPTLPEVPSKLAAATSAAFPPPPPLAPTAPAPANTATSAAFPPPPPLAPTAPAPANTATSAAFPPPPPLAPTAPAPANAARAPASAQPVPVAAAVAPTPSPSQVPTLAAPLPTENARLGDPMPPSSRTMHTPTGPHGISKLWGRAASAVDRLGPGSTLGRYEILMPVAKGGMAAVWAARLQGTRGFQKIVAVKTMLPDVSDDPDFQSMFLDEARVAARIKHPNVVEILDLGEENDVLFLVMEWVDGETVSTLQKAAKPLGGLPQRIVLRIASQICAGLHNAHELRDDSGALVDLVHRDISPANVLISTAGFVKIVDFGVAKSKGRLHITRAGGVIKGKTPYLSPEQLGGLPIDRRSDIFSLGALLYVLTTGLHPFRAENEMMTVENIALKNPLAPRELNEAIHPEFDRIILKALEKDQEKRFSTCAEMQRAIDQVASMLGQPTTDDDVADFVRQAIGDIDAKRMQDLRDAIAAADATSVALSEPRPVVTSEAQSSADGVTVAGGKGSAAISSPEISEEISFDEMPSDDHPPKLIIAASVQPTVKAGAEPEIVPATVKAPPSGKTTLPLARPAPKVLPAAGMPPRLVATRGATRPAGTDLGEDTAVDRRSFSTGQRRKRLQFIVAGAAAICIAIGALALLVRSGEEHSPTGRTTQVLAEPPVATAPAGSAQPPEPIATASPAPAEPAAKPDPAEPPAKAEPAEPAPAEKPAAPVAAKETPSTRAAAPSTTRAPTTRAAPTRAAPTRPAPKPTPTTRKKYNPLGI